VREMEVTKMMGGKRNTTIGHTLFVSSGPLLSLAITSLSTCTAMKIVDKMKAASAEGKTFFSFEYFPPRTEEVWTQEAAAGAQSGESKPAGARSLLSIAASPHARSAHARSSRGGQVGAGRQGVGCRPRAVFRWPCGPPAGRPAARSPRHSFFGVFFFPPPPPPSSPPPLFLSQGVTNLIERQHRMVALGPLFCDITWGAGGTTADLTLEIAARMQRDVGVETMMHLTCTNMPVEQLDDALDKV